MHSVGGSWSVKENTNSRIFPLHRGANSESSLPPEPRPAEDPLHRSSVCRQETLAHQCLCQIDPYWVGHWPCTGPGSRTSRRLPYSSAGPQPGPLIMGLLLTRRIQSVRTLGPHNISLAIRPQRHTARRAIQRPRRTLDLLQPPIA